MQFVWSDMSAAGVMQWADRVGGWTPAPPAAVHPSIRRAVHAGTWVRDGSACTCCWCSTQKMGVHTAEVPRHRLSTPPPCACTAVPSSSCRSVSGTSPPHPATHMQPACARPLEARPATYSRGRLAAGISNAWSGLACLRGASKYTYAACCCPLADWRCPWAGGFSCDSKSTTCASLPSGISS